MAKKISIIAVLFFAIIGAVVGYFACDINGLTGADTSYNLEIEKSDFEYQIGEKLEQNGIVKKGSVWVRWMRAHYPDFVYINGEYFNITADMSYHEIAHKLQNPDVSHRSVKVVIPEGFNVFDIAVRLEENNICTASEFLQECQNKDGYDYSWLSEIPDNDLIAFELEGFLFPATYDFGENTPAKEIVNAMLATFDSKISDDMLSFCKENDMTLYNLVNLASIVQEEALTQDSAGNIASVFINRLNVGMKLQSDVTYFYAASLREEHGFSQAVYDSYYTYRCNGLPSGPVCNPGLQVIDATINHPDTDYLYFFSDLNQEFHFAKDYDTFMSLQKQYPWK